MKTELVKGDFGVIIGYTISDDNEEFTILDWELDGQPKEITSEELILLKKYLENKKGYKQSIKYVSEFLKLVVNK